MHRVETSLKHSPAVLVGHFAIEEFARELCGEVGRVLGQPGSGLGFAAGDLFVDPAQEPFLVFRRLLCDFRRFRFCIRSRAVFELRDLFLDLR